MTYNPFNKRLGEKLDPTDLQDLITFRVAEGYQIEYKGNVFPTPEKISHSIASLANTYGGWYIIGVKTDGNNIANDICGFNLTTYPKPIDSIRDIIKHHIDPIPLFYPQVVELGNDLAVLVIHVPAEQDTPFITKNGRIYRRVQDSSDPVPENNRYAIDTIVQNGREANKQFERFRQDKRTFSKEESEHPWTNIFIAPYPFGIVEKNDLAKQAELKKLLELSTKPIESGIGFASNIPFNIAQPTLTSVILKQIAADRLRFNSLSVELFQNGNAKFHIPIPVYGFDELIQNPIFKSDKVIANLKKFKVSNDDFFLFKFVNISQLTHAITALLSFYQKWLGEQSLIFGFKIAITLENIWRIIPLVDADEWVEHIEAYGLPIINKNNASFPPKELGGILIEKPSNDFFSLAAQIFNVVGLELGIPPELIPIAFSKFITFEKIQQ